MDILKIFHVHVTIIVQDFSYPSRNGSTSRKYLLPHNTYDASLYLTLLSRTKLELDTQQLVLLTFYLCLFHYVECFFPLCPPYFLDSSLSLLCCALLS